MFYIRRLLIVLLIGCFFSCNITFAQLQYSVGPNCQENKVICPNPDQVPICIILEPRVHVEYVENTDGKKINRFEPNCIIDNDIQIPTCLDISSELTKSNVAIECIEPIKCKLNENNKLIASCETRGKEPKCLGGHSIEPNCDQEEICDNSIPVCDYSWQAFTGESNIH